MGRASAAEAAENRQHILTTACRLIRSHGIENISNADIMRETGLTQGALYTQFQSRQALLDEALELAFHQALTAWSEVLSEHDDNESLLKLMQHYFRQRPAKNNCPMLMFSSAVRTSAPASPAAEVYRNGVEDLYESFPISNDHPQKAVLFAAMIGTGLLGQAMGNTRWLEQIQGDVLDAATDSFTNPAGSRHRSDSTVLPSKPRSDRHRS